MIFTSNGNYTQYKVQEGKYKVQEGKYKVQEGKYKVQGGKYKVQETVADYKRLFTKQIKQKSEQFNHYKNIFRLI